MVNARLHIICGNCGQNDMFTYQINNEIDDDTNEKYQTVNLICNNCHTIHDLDTNARKETYGGGEQ